MIDTRAVLTETGVLAVFALGWIVSRRLGRVWRRSEISVMYALGLLFELLTAHMWTYHHIFLLLPTRIDHDISVLFPLGWAGLIMTATPVAESLWKRWRLNGPIQRHLVLMAAWLLIGDLSETTFYRAGMIEYVNDSSTAANFCLGQWPGLPPTMVLVGYGLLQPFVTHYFRWLERDIGGRRQG